jgi:hypothetical protein
VKLGIGSHAYTWIIGVSGYSGCLDGGQLTIYGLLQKAAALGVLEGPEMVIELLAPPRGQSPH